MTNRYPRLAVLLLLAFVASISSHAGVLPATCPVIGLTPATNLADGVTQAAYPDTAFTASGSTFTPYTYQITGGVAPGLSLDPSTGVLSGTPTAGGSFLLSITATDTVGCSGGRVYSLNVLPDVASTVPANGATAVLPTTKVTVTFTEAVNATAAAFTLECPGGTPATFTSNPALPGNATSFVLTPDSVLPSGTLCAAKVVAAQVTSVAFPALHLAADHSFSFTTGTAPSITSANSASFASTGNNTFTVTTTGSPTNASMSITETGALPGGISFLNNNDGTATLSGTPDAGAYLGSPYLLTIKADNGIAPVAQQSFTLTVLPPPPTALDDPAYTATGGLSIAVDAGTGVTANDTLNGAAIASYGATTGSEQTTIGNATATAQGGSVSMVADGSFTYQAPAGATLATDSFKYTLTNGGGSSTATVTVTLQDRVIFVDNSAGAGDGRLGSPYNSMAGVPAAGSRAPAGKKALIYVYNGAGAYGGTNLTLGSGDTLVGQGVGFASALTVAGIVPPANTITAGYPAASSNPTLSGTAGAIVTLSGDNIVDALNLSASAGASAITGAPTGTSTVENGTATCVSSAACISVTGGVGTLNLVSMPTTQSGGRGVGVAGKTGGSVTFDASSGVSVTAGTTDAILLSSNTGATITFNGPLAIATSGAGARGFVASGGGTVNATAAGSTVATTSSSAIDVQNTTIGASGLTFQSVSANGAGTGILLSSTGTGAFTISGTGSTGGSGGTVQACTAKGADIRSASNVTLKNMNFTNNGTANLAAATVCGDIVAGGNNGPANCNANVSLSSSSNVTLDNVSATGSKQIGIDGNAVGNLTLTNVTATGNGDEVGEDGVQLFNTSGTLTVSGGLFKDNAATQFEVGASTGTLAATISGATFSLTNFPTTSGPNPPSPGNATANSGLYFHANSGSNATISPTVTGSTFQNIYSYALRWDAANGTSTGTINFGQAGNGNTFTNNGLGIGVSTTGNGNVTYNIRNSTFSNNTAVTTTFNTTAISISMGGTGATHTGLIDSNTIGSNSAGATASGCFVGGCDGIQVVDTAAPSVTHNATVTNNSVFHVKGAAVRVNSNGLSGGASDTMRVKIANNTVNFPDDATSVTTAVLIQDGNTAPQHANFSCIDINGNAIGGLWAPPTSHKSAIRFSSPNASSVYAVAGYNSGTEYAPGAVTAGCTSACTGTSPSNGNAADFLSQQNPTTITLQTSSGGSSASQAVTATITGVSGPCP